jgi:hypothetical protein
MNGEALSFTCVHPICRRKLIGAAGLMEIGIAESLRKVSHGIAEGCAFKVDDTGNDGVAGLRD